MAGERSIRETKTIKSHALEILRNKTGNVDDENKVAHKEEGECG